MPRLVRAPALVATLLRDEGNDEAADIIDDLLDTRDEILAALKALMAEIDSGLLVRDITRDGEPGWSLHIIDFVKRLNAAQAAIAKAEGR